VFIGQDNGVDSYLVQNIVDIAGPIVDQQNALHALVVVVGLTVVTDVMNALPKKDERKSVELYTQPKKNKKKYQLILYALIYYF
jgi:pheromone shutdown protein TraB